MITVAACFWLVSILVFGVSSDPIGSAISFMVGIIIVDYYLTQYEYKLESDIHDQNRVITSGSVFPYLSTIRNNHTHYLTEPDHVNVFTWDSKSGCWDFVTKFGYDDNKPLEFASIVQEDIT